MWLYSLSENVYIQAHSYVIAWVISELFTASLSAHQNPTDQLKLDLCLVAFCGYLC